MLASLQVAQEFNQVCLGHSVRRSIHQPKVISDSLPLLVSLEAEKFFYLYLAAFEKTLAAVLIKETQKGQFPIYYVSKALYDFELNYSCHNGFPLDLDDHKTKMKSPPIFSVRV